MDINGVQGPGSSLPLDHVSNARPTQATQGATPERLKTDAAASRHKDTVVISDEARIRAYLEQAREEPETRPEKMQEAQDRIESGDYDRPEVNEALARFLLQRGIV